MRCLHNAQPLPVPMRHTRRCSGFPGLSLRTAMPQLLSRGLTGQPLIPSHLPVHRVQLSNVRWSCQCFRHPLRLRLMLRRLLPQHSLLLLLLLRITWLSSRRCRRGHITRPSDSTWHHVIPRLACSPDRPALHLRTLRRPWRCNERVVLRPSPGGGIVPRLRLRRNHLLLR